MVSPTWRNWSLVYKTFSGFVISRNNQKIAQIPIIIETIWMPFYDWGAVRIGEGDTQVSFHLSESFGGSMIQI